MMRSVLVAAATVGIVALGVVAARAAMQVAPIRAGSVAPEFELRDQDNAKRRLSAAPGRFVALTFYPADATPGCTLEARSIRDGLNALKEHGISVFGVSVQDVPSKRAFCDKESLNYPILADTGGKVAAAYGVLMPVGLAQRVTFVISRKGKRATVRSVIEGVDVKSHAQQIIDAVRALEAPKQP